MLDATVGTGHDVVDVIVGTEHDVVEMTCADRA